MYDVNQSWRKLLSKIKLYNEKYETKVDLDIIVKAISFAKKYHSGQFRDSGEPFYTHPIEVAYMLCDYCFKTDILVTAILHDTIEDTAATKQIISENFGSKISDSVMDLTRIKDDGTKISAAQLVELLFNQKKYELLLVKQFDRIHNMQTIQAKPAEKIKKTIKETIYTFTVLAAYLGTRNIEEEIINLCSRLIDYHNQPYVADEFHQMSDDHLVSLALQSVQ